MKKTLIILAAAMLAACTASDKQLMRRAAELCRYIPDHTLLEQSREYLTADFYAALDTMFNHLPDEEPLAHEWLYYFVTGNGGTIADFTVTAVERTNATHAVATVEVRQQWEDGTFDSTTDIERHTMLMEKVDGRWLMADFDGHKADCLRHIAGYRQEQAVRDAIGDYLVRQIGVHYLQGELCVPTLMIVAADKVDSTTAHVWCDCWVDWYNRAGDTLKCVSGGNHSGCFTLEQHDGQPVVTAFEQTVDGAGWLASARRIFGQHIDIYQNIHGNQDVREANRALQLRNYLRRHSLEARYYQDYGWPAVEIGQ